MSMQITDWPAHSTDPVPVPLPHLGLCGECDDEIRIRTDGRLYAHGCPGDGHLPVVALEATFARWLWKQSRRRDDYTNRLTLFAGRIFRPCTRTTQSARDVDWSTAEELHGRLHLGRPVRTGSAGCDSLCRALAEAGRYYEQLSANASVGPRRTVWPVHHEPVVRVHRHPTGWALPDFTDLADCTSNHIPGNSGRQLCTAAAVWKVVEDHGMHLTLSFWCDSHLPDEHWTRRDAA